MSLKYKGILIFLHFILINSIKEESMIVFPFKTISLPFFKDYRKDQNNDISNKSYNSTKFFDEHYIFRILSPMKIGDPPQEIIAFINIYYEKLLIGELLEIPDKIFDNSFYRGYNYKKSSSFINLTLNNINLFNNESKIFIGEEKIYLFTSINDIQNNKYSCFPNFRFNIEKTIEYNNNLLYGLIIGLVLSDNYYESNFMRQIHDRNIISKYIVSFEFTNNEDGMLIIGKYPHEYSPDKYSEENLKSFYSYQPRTMYLTNFVISFNEIYSLIDNEKYSLKQKSRSILVLNSRLIIGTKEYMEFIENYFFKEYININICEKYFTNTNSLDDFIIFSCLDDEKLKLSEFPNLNFNMKSENLTLELNYKDLFKNIGNNYYFLIAFEKFGGYAWRLGKPLFLKYTFVYNGDSKTIGFYLKKKLFKNEDIIKKDWKIELNIFKIIIIIILFLIFIFLIIIISYYLGKKYNLIRKKHANELEDEYDYNSSKDINDKNNNDFKKKHVELRDESKFNL